MAQDSENFSERVVVYVTPRVRERDYAGSGGE